MPRCIQCKKWGLFLKLQNGRCSSCYNLYLIHAGEFQNLQRILTESLSIIRKTKYLDTLEGRKLLYIERYKDLMSLSERYQFTIPSSISPLDSFIKECEERETSLKQYEVNSDISSTSEDNRPRRIPKCTPINQIFSTFLSLSPSNQGISLDFVQHPENLDKAIQCYQQQVAYYYEQKEKYVKISSRHARNWSKTFEHWHNIKNPDFCAVDLPEKRLKKLIKHRDIIRNFKSKVIDVIRDHPGIKQKDMPAFFDAEFEQRCFSTIRDLSNSGIITRVRNGRSYSLYFNSASPSTSQLVQDNLSCKSSVKE